MLGKPITVLLPAYNAAPYIEAAIQSILDQTFKNFELMVIDDGSTDETPELIQQFQDPRINYIRNPENLKFRATLNKGLDLIDSKYIARMDADDIAMPERLERQFAFMESHPEIGIVGTAIEIFGQQELIKTLPESNHEIQALCLFAAPFAHPSVMIRNSVIKQHDLKFAPNYPAIEDWELWTRLTQVTQSANLPDVLLRYRWEGQNMTVQTLGSRLERYYALYKELLNRMNISPTEEELKIHYELSQGGPTSFPVSAYQKWSQRLLKQNAEIKAYPHGELSIILEKLQQQLFYSCADKGLKEFISYTKSYGINTSQLNYFLRTSAKKILKH